MAGESVVQLSSFATVVASDTVADGAMSDATTTTILAALGATDEDAPLLDFKLDITSGTPTDGGRVDLYFRPSDGTDQSPAPDAAYLPHCVGSFLLTNATDEYYLYQVPNLDKNGTYYWMNNDGSVTLTATLYARSRTFNVAS